MVRESGFYWVLPRHESRWVVAEWAVDHTAENWALPGDDRPHDDSELDEIGPKVMPPEEVEDMAHYARHAGWTP